MRIVVVTGICGLVLSGCMMLDGPGMWEQQHVSTSPEQTPTPPRQTGWTQDPLPVTTLGPSPLTVESRGPGAKDDAICRSYGTYPGTTPYVQCRLGLRKMEQDDSDESPLGSLFGN